MGAVRFSLAGYDFGELEEVLGMLKPRFRLRIQRWSGQRYPRIFGELV